MIDLGTINAVPGDFYKYLLSNVSDILQNTRKMNEDLFRYFLADEYYNNIEGLDSENEKLFRHILANKYNNEERELMSMFTIYHEIVHLVQEFTLGSEILRDYLNDMIHGKFFAFLKMHEMVGKQLSLPLKQSNLLRNNEITTRLLTLLDDIYSKNIFIEIPDEKPVAIGTTEIVEAYAAAKSFYYIIQCEPDPYYYKNTNVSYFNDGLQDKYRNAWHVFEKKVALDKKPYDGGPLNPLKSLDLKSFLLICDISLHIPVPAFDKCLQKNYKLPEYNLPYERFRGILQTIEKNNGYPDAVEGEDYYITLFDFIARRNGWPTFQETMDGWCSWIAERMVDGFMVSDGYRMICANYKKEHANELLVAPPASFFCRTGIPVLVRYYGDEHSLFEYVRLFGTNPVNVLSSKGFDPFVDPYNIMINPENRNDWSASDFIMEMHKSGAPWTVRAGNIFMREIICRIFSKEFYASVHKEKCFCCPLVDLHCETKKDNCTYLKRLVKLPDKCSLAIWLEESGIQPNYFQWE